MVENTQFPAVPLVLDKWEEAHRRDATAINYLLGNVFGGGGDPTVPGTPLGILERIERLENIIVELTVAGYGGGVQAVPVPNFDILGVYNTLPFDTHSPNDSRGMTFFPITNNFDFAIAGPWQINMTFNIAGHNESQGARSFIMRLYNENLSAAGEGVTIGIGRNTADTFVSATAIFDITQDDVDNGYRFHNEVGDADINITGGDLTANAIQAVFVGELGSVL